MSGLWCVPVRSLHSGPPSCPPLAAYPWSDNFQALSRPCASKYCEVNYLTTCMMSFCSICSGTYPAFVRQAAANSTKFQDKVCSASRRISCADHILWNLLPPNICNCDSISTFKNFKLNWRLFCHDLDIDWSEVEFVLLSHLLKWNYST